MKFKIGFLITSILVSSGVVTVALVPRLTFIDQTPGYHHLSTESNGISAKNFSHCQSIWPKNLHNLIRKMLNVKCSNM